MLKWTEEWASDDAMKDNFDPNANFGRPPLLHIHNARKLLRAACPTWPSRITS